MIGLTALSGSLALSAQVVVSSGFEQLDRWASECLAERSMTLGYPGNNDIRLEEFYRWYTGNNLESMIINNAGDPFEEGDHTLPHWISSVRSFSISLLNTDLTGMTCGALSP